MPLKDFLPLIKFIGSMLAPILYIVCFASKNWVTIKDKRYGLWEWCYPNWSDDVNNNNYVNDTQCHTISPGDSPAYYEAVRTLGTFTLVLHILYFCTCNEREGMGKEKNPCTVAFLATMGAVLTLAIMGACYKDDDRWKDYDPSLGWCFWVVTGCAIVDGFMIWVFWMSYKSKQTQTSNAAVTPTEVRPRQPNPNGSTLSLDSRRKVTIFSSHSNIGRDGSSTSGAVAPSGAGTTAGDRSSSGAASARPTAGPNRREGSVGQFPVLTLPQYYIPPEPGSTFPYIAPPSYEEITRGTLSPPPPYTVPEHER